MDDKILTEKIRAIFYDYILPMHKEYPNISAVKGGLERNTFYVQLLNNAGLIRPGVSVVDMGSGMCYFPVILSYLGLNVTTVDDFAGGGGLDKKSESICNVILGKFKAAGVTMIRQELLTNKLPMASGSVDAVTCIHTLEHWHNSPKDLFGEIRRILKPGGLLILVTPNSVNLRKRIWVLMGKSNLCPIDEWYNRGDPFRGHAREPSVSDLKKLMQWNGFSVKDVYGRNFIGQESTLVSKLPPALLKLYRIALSLTDSFLRIDPALCTDICVVGKKEIDERRE